MIVGVTGGIGSGKSSVAKFLAISGFPIYIADIEAKRLMVSSVEIVTALKALLGDEAYIGKELNRPFVAKKIFEDASLLKQVNDIVHPVVRADFKRWVEEQTSPVVGVESAILFESGLIAIVDKVLVVTASLEERIARVIQRDGVSREQVMSRIAAQISDEERVKRADFVVNNNEDVAITPQLLSFMASVV